MFWTKILINIFFPPGTLTLPVDTAVIISIHMLHRDPCHWEEPNKVKPERFLPENVKQRDPNAFVPFSLGPMDCLGSLFFIVKNC